MSFWREHTPSVALLGIIWVVVIGFVIGNYAVLAQSPTDENDSVHVAGITPTATSPAATATPAAPGTPPPGVHTGVTIPEPTSIALMGLGLASLAGYVRRRRNNK